MDSFIRGAPAPPDTPVSRFLADLKAFVLSFAGGLSMATTAPAWTSAPLAVTHEMATYRFDLYKHYDVFVRVMQEVFREKNQRMVQELDHLPAYAAGQRAWEPGNAATNDYISHALIRELNVLLRDVYGCRCARVIITDAVKGELWGMYSPCKRLVYVRKSLYGRPFADFFGTYVHEQMHCLQHDMMQRFEMRSRQDLSFDECYLIQYWMAEARFPNTPGVYERLGREVHANWVGHAVIAA